MISAHHTTYKRRDFIQYEVSFILIVFFIVSLFQAFTLVGRVQFSKREYCCVQKSRKKKISLSPVGS